MNKKVAIILSGLLLVGCAPGTITIVTQPEGAYIAAGGNALGLAPLRQTIRQDVQAPKDSSGCYLLPAVDARWASGASASSPNPTRLCNGLRANYTITIQRPAGAPGLNQDLAIANQQAAARAQQRAADAQQAAAIMQMMGSQQPVYQQQQRLQTNCFSTVEGNNVITNCR